MRLRLAMTAAPLDDLRATRLCAEAMGYVETVNPDPRARLPTPPAILYADRGGLGLFNPLHDDAQCMALVKRFRIALVGPIDDCPERAATVMDADCWRAKCWENYDQQRWTADFDLNRAIVYCVAAMWQAKEAR